MKNNLIENTFEEVLNDLLELIRKKDSSSIRSLLTESTSSDNPPTIHRGQIFEHLIAILINSGHNHAYVNPLVKDQGNDILHYSKTYVLLECIQAKNLSRQLSKYDIEIEISKHNKSNLKEYPFIIVSSSGFNIDNNTKLSYSKKGVYLKNFDYIDELINSFSEKNNKTPLSSYNLQDNTFFSYLSVLIEYNTPNDLYAYYRLPLHVKAWCTNIRNSYKLGTLNIKEKLLLDKIGFYWCFEDIRWDISYFKVKDIFLEYGTTYNNVKCPSLKSWLRRQVLAYLNCSLPHDKLVKLNKINVLNDWILNIDLIN